MNEAEIAKIMASEYINIIKRKYVEIIDIGFDKKAAMGIISQMINEVGKHYKGQHGNYNNMYIVDEKKCEVINELNIIIKKYDEIIKNNNLSEEKFAEIFTKEFSLELQRFYSSDNSGCLGSAASLIFLIFTPVCLFLWNLQ